MRTMELGFAGTPLRRQLVDAVLRGEKTATAGLLVDYERVAAWREAHERFWRGYADEIRAYLGDPSWDITDDTLFVAERFRVVERL